MGCTKSNPQGHGQSIIGQGKSKNEEVEALIQAHIKRNETSWKYKTEKQKQIIRQKAEIQFTYKKLVDGLKAGKFKKIVLCTGAGISVSAGIPDFRSPNVGLYDNLEKLGYSLPTPESIFTLSYFNRYPGAFYKLANDFLDTSKFDPTPTHHFIKLLQDKGILQFCMTQNIDNLEEKAGLDMKNKVRQAHGANRGAHCGVCKKQQDSKVLAEHIAKGEVLYCSKQNCNGPVKPDITFFGEGLPEQFFTALDKIENADENPEDGCDLMIVVGTALAVSPFNQTVNRIKDTTPCVLFNMECEVPRENGFDFEDMLKHPNRLYVQGKCDETLSKLCRDVGWINDLISINPERMAKAGIINDQPKTKL